MAKLKAEEGVGSGIVFSDYSTDSDSDAAAAASGANRQFRALNRTYTPQHVRTNSARYKKYQVRYSSLHKSVLSLLAKKEAWDGDVEVSRSMAN